MARVVLAKDMYTLCFMIQILYVVSAVTTRGIVPLDDLTFYKVICHHTVCIVKFDKKYNYGPQENEFQKFALRVASNTEILVAELGTTDWGEKENHATRQKFNVSTEDYPVLKMFYKDDLNTNIVYNTVLKVDLLVQWLRNHSNLYIGSGILLDVFEGLAKELVTLVTRNNNIQDGCNVIIKTGEKELDNVPDENNKILAQIFLRIMTKICDKGVNYISTEFGRVKKLLKQKIQDEKRRKLEAKIKVLKIFSKILSHVYRS